MAVVPTTFTDGGVPHTADFAFLLNPPAGIAYQSGTQTLATASWVAMTFNTLILDTDPTMWVVGTATRLNLNAPGRYRIDGGVEWALNGTGHRAIQIRMNSAGSVAGGTLVHGITVPPVATANSSVQCGLLSPILFAAGDYLELFALQTSGGNLATQQQVSGLGSAYLSARWHNQ